jgi:hypothetical protein
VPRPEPSTTIGGLLRGNARAARRPAVYEARIASTADTRGRVFVTCRALTGDTQRLGPFLAPPYTIGATTYTPGPKDRAWLALDEGGDPACLVRWEKAA